MSRHPSTSGRRALRAVVASVLGGLLLAAGTALAGPASAATAPTIDGNPPRGAVDQAYDYTFTLGGDPLPTTTVTDGSLPPGLALDTNGRISGVPTTDGYFPFTITADNGTGSTATWPGALYVDATVPTATGTPPVGTVGQPYDFTFTLGGGPTPTVFVYPGALPPGLTLSPDGHVTGTPTAAGTYGVGIAAQNDAGTYGYVFGFIVQGSTTTGTPTLSVADRRMAEGNSGTRAMTFTVTLSAPSSTRVTVHWRTQNGTARAAGDYVAAAGTVTFAPGQTRKTVTVLVKGDRIRERDEAFCLLLGSPTGATLADAHAVGVIANDD